MFYFIYKNYINFALAIISSFGYLIKGTELLLVPLIVHMCYLLFTSLLNFAKKPVLFRKELLVIAFSALVLLAGTLINTNVTLALKVILYMLVGYFVVGRGVFCLKSYSLSLIATVFIYFIFLQDQFNQYGTMSFFEYARNFTVFIVVIVLLALNRSLLFVNAITFISLSRWNFISLIGAYSKYLVVLLIVAAYVKLFVFKFDTGAGLKTASDDIRAVLTLEVIKNLDFYFYGVSYADVQHRLGSIFTVDSFESLNLERISYFGVFGIPIMYLHFRLYYFGCKAKSSALRSLCFYLFMFPFFNPLTFSIAYYIFYYHSYFKLVKERNG